MERDPWSPGLHTADRAVTAGDFVLAAVAGGAIPLLPLCGGGLLPSVLAARVLEFGLVALVGGIAGARVARRSSRSPLAPASQLGFAIALIHTVPIFIFFMAMAALSRSPTALGTPPEKAPMLALMAAACDAALASVALRAALGFLLATSSTYWGMVLARSGAVGASWQGPSPHPIAPRALAIELLGFAAAMIVVLGLASTAIDGLTLFAAGAIQEALAMYPKPSP